MPIKGFTRSCGLLLLAISAIVASSCAADEPTGRWKGRWSSDSTGHSGPMRARVTATDRGTYKAIFAGRFAGIIPFVYRAELVPTQTWDGVGYTTLKRLPLLGSYRMQTAIDGNLFNANWSAVGDTGQVRLLRVAD